MLIILFGLAGSGKNFVGHIISNKFGYLFWDADEALTSKMKEAILEKKQFTQSMRDEYVQNIVIDIEKLLKVNSKLVIAQALYKEQNRLQILNHFPNAIFIQVCTNWSVIIKRLVNASENLIDLDYAKLILQQYEEPQLPHKIVTNNDDEAAVISQLIKLNI